MKATAVCYFIDTLEDLPIIQYASSSNLLPVHKEENMRGWQTATGNSKQYVKKKHFIYDYKQTSQKHHYQSTGNIIPISRSKNARLKRLAVYNLSAVSNKGHNNITIQITSLVMDL